MCSPTNLSCVTVGLVVRRYGALTFLPQCTPIINIILKMDGDASSIFKECSVEVSRTTVEGSHSPMRRRSQRVALLEGSSPAEGSETGIPGGVGPRLGSGRSRSRSASAVSAVPDGVQNHQSEEGRPKHAEVQRPSLARSSSPSTSSQLFSLARDDGHDGSEDEESYNITSDDDCPTPPYHPVEDRLSLMTDLERKNVTGRVSRLLLRYRASSKNIPLEMSE